MRKILMHCAALSSVFLLVVTAQADLWDYPNEISVTEVYNDMYGTMYEETTEAGLAELLADHQGTMMSTWNTSFFKTIDVFVYDTSATSPLTVKTTPDSTYLIFDPGPWTPPSRGDILMEKIDLVDLLGEDTYFSISVGSTLLDSSNTLMIEGIDYYTTNTFFLAHNEGGWSGDSDFNEPLMIANTAPVPEPATLLLVTTGLIGVAGFSRKRRKK